MSVYKIRMKLFIGNIIDQSDEMEPHIVLFTHIYTTKSGASSKGYKRSISSDRHLNIGLVTQLKKLQVMLEYIGVVFYKTWQNRQPIHARVRKFSENAEKISTIAKSGI